MRVYTSVFVVFLLLLLVSACTERIELNLDEGYTRLVVDGAFTTDTTAHRVVIKTTSSYFYNQPEPMVKGAKVSISDGIQTFSLKEIQPGVYCTASSAYGVSGHTYTLNIQLASPIGGQSEYSARSTILPISPLDSVNLKFHRDWGRKGIWEVKCYVQEPPSIDFYRFLVYKNSELLTDTLNEWFVTDDKFFNGNYTNGATVAYLQQGSTAESLAVGDTITVEVNSISKEYANFLWEAQAELRGSNPLFSGPPANFKGNISNGAIGFFAAYSCTRSFTLVPAFP